MNENESMRSWLAEHPESHIEERPKREDEWLMGLGPMNTVADFVSELYDSLFRDILGNDVMDRTLGSFDKQDLFRVMARIFLQDGNQVIMASTGNHGKIVRTEARSRLEFEPVPFYFFFVNKKGESNEEGNA